MKAVWNNFRLSKVCKAVTVGHLKHDAFLTIKWWCPCFHAGLGLSMTHKRLVYKYMHSLVRYLPSIWDENSLINNFYFIIFSTKIWSDCENKRQMCVFPLVLFPFAFLRNLQNLKQYEDMHWDLGVIQSSPKPEPLPVFCPEDPFRLQHLCCGRHILDLSLCEECCASKFAAFEETVSTEIIFNEAFYILMLAVGVLMLCVILPWVWAGIRGNRLHLASVPERLVIPELRNASSFLGR